MCLSHTQLLTDNGLEKSKKKGEKINDNDHESTKQKGIDYSRMRKIRK